MKVAVQLKVNNEEVRVEVEPQMTLIELLRDQLKVMSVHRGCEEGECGACTVLADGEPLYSCITLAVQADGMEIRTVDGLSQGDEMHPLNKAFLENHGSQCGYCTPGFIMTAHSLIDKSEGELTETEIRKGLEGNLCRCTGYVNIVKGVKAAQKEKDAGNWW